MPRFAANLSMMYTDLGFLDRFAAAAKDGFKAVEFLFPYEYPAAEIAARLKDCGLQQVLFNAPPGDWAAGERGITCLPGREKEFREGVLKALEYAHALDCPRIHTMAGVAPAGAERARLREIYVANVTWATEKAQAAGRDVVMEPIAPKNIPGFFLNRQDEAHAIAAESGKANLRVQMDLFHCQVGEGDLTASYGFISAIKRRAGWGICRLPACRDAMSGLGEINYEFLFDVIDGLGFEGWIGCEYTPKAGTSEGLGWFKKRLAAKR